MERQISIKILADEYHAADALREIANYIENAESEEEVYGSTLKNAHYIATIEDE